ncbi:MAG: DsbC/DsbD-like thiol-disulfide interchange protein [Candidatus Marinamargulisbacteria bacterium]
MNKRTSFFRHLCWICIFTLAILRGGAIFGETVPDTKVDLVSNLYQFSGETTFYVGFLITPSKGWHTYWTNPGDSGSPMRFKWEIPEGFKELETIWPAPSRIISGDVVNYGYVGETMIATRFMAPKTLTPNQVIEVRLTANWVVCEEVCVAETKVLSILFRTGHLKFDPGRRKIYKFLSELPKAYPFPTTAVATLSEVVVNFQDPKHQRIASAYIFPDSSVPISASAKQNISRDPGGFSLTMPLESPVIVEISGFIQLSYIDGTSEIFQLDAFAVNKKVSPKKEKR